MSTKLCFSLYKIVPTTPSLSILPVLSYSNKILSENHIYLEKSWKKKLGQNYAPTIVTGFWWRKQCHNFMWQTACVRKWHEDKSIQKFGVAIKYSMPIEKKGIQCILPTRKLQALETLRGVKLWGKASGICTTLAGRAFRYTWEPLGKIHWGLCLPSAAIWLQDPSAASGSAQSPFQSPFAPPREGRACRVGAGSGSGTAAGSGKPAGRVPPQAELLRSRPFPPPASHRDLSLLHRNLPSNLKMQILYISLPPSYFVCM